MLPVTAPSPAIDLTETLDRLCGLAAGPVCVAVSGGGDSLALLLLAADWSRRRSRPLLALTVDHGLRPEAADEARFVAGVAARLGVAHRTLRWQAPLPGQAKARTARHTLLAAAAAEAGSGLILTAHTEDDQAETFLIRARAGSGWYGLAGIQPVGLSPAEGQGRPVLLGRPLLAVARQSLRNMLAAAGQDWVEDPSNENAAYERVRMRRRLAQEPALRARVLSCQRRLQLLRRLHDRAEAQWLRRHVTIREDGTVIASACLPEGDRGERALARLIGLAAARTRPIRGDAVARLAHRLRTPEHLRPATLGGAIVSARPEGLRIVAERALGPELVNAMPARLVAIGTACSGDM